MKNVKNVTSIITYVGTIGVAIGFIVLVLISSCTEKQKVRNYGGTETFRLKPGEKLLQATWKGEKGASNLWYLTRKMHPNETADTIYFRESSDYGVWEGTVVFVESK